jgi:2-polyprenyl-3-methyl-5-hydroxy-6-metoxy-1,4-benzoquinol methylase
VADFDQFAHDYTSVLDQCVGLSGETSQYFADYKARYLAAALADCGDVKKILDYGCGTGQLSAALKKRLPNAIHHGYDVSQASLDRVDSTLARSGRFTSDLARLDNDYDAIVMAAVLHHIPVVKRDQIIREVANRLRANGRVLIFEHNPFNPVTRWVVNQCQFDRDAVLLKPKEAIAHLRAAGLRFVRRDYIVFFPRPLSLCRPLERYLRWCPMGAQYVITGSKSQ